ncbi:hypothetical protein GWI33_001760 [Rhynchophorus ferrugineus]|uniref:Uncharacterized protein n=1 Tax=Rhynchophorus ferrugineus TaxID=354439 RepID=A0A834ILC8_RHYFE|nr:hypothetical protein GWI33_001760 [Rhynchophorus ferrugineus]
MSMINDNVIGEISCFNLARRPPDGNVNEICVNSGTGDSSPSITAIATPITTTWIQGIEGRGRLVTDEVTFVMGDENPPFPPTVCLGRLWSDLIGSGAAAMLTELKSRIRS